MTIGQVKAELEAVIVTLEASKEGSKEGAKEGSMEGADDAGGSNGERGLGTDGDGVAVPTAAEE